MYRKARILPLSSALPICAGHGWKGGVVGVWQQCVRALSRCFIQPSKKTKAFLETGGLALVWSERLWDFYARWHALALNPGLALNILCHCIIIVGCGDEL